jgi:predicted nucleic acid-binding protein
MAGSAKAVVVDAGYWYALFDARDALHTHANVKASHIDSLTVVFPWPTLYETLGTRFVKNRLGMDGLERLLKRPNVRLIDDSPYRDAALDATLQEGRLGKRAISLCDMMIRLMLEDVNLQIHAILTFNVKDFADVCRSGKIEIL